MLGGILVKLAFVACLGSIIAFFENHRSGNKTALRIGRVLFHATVIGVLAFSAVQLYNILTHQFQYTYVWSYSSRDLPLPLLISTFYAGQEGSFMLWALFTALIGVFLMEYSSRKGYEPQVMSVFGMILLSLLLMMIVKNPFAFVWESWEGQVAVGFQPNDGRGLNPLLQNYWMVIHPQVLFSGFAAMSVPYAYAVAALMKKDYNGWIKLATPWIVYGATVLGLGIMLGGFWAYETLGWGGYWAWDPVENSSLVPWLFSVATIHTILTQRKSGAFVRTNLVLAMLCFITVLYSTFLTRSGVLGDTSVHSFVDPGMWVYWLLIGVILTFIGIGAVILLIRWREMPKIPPGHAFLSREFALFLGSAALVCVAVFVTVGTSAPIITQITEGKTTAVDISYYVKTTLPLGVAIAILAAIGQLLWWSRMDTKAVVRSLAVPAAISAAATLLLAIFVNLHDIWIALFVFGSVFALLANLQVGWRIVKGNPKFAGGSVAHIGLAVMFLGFVASSKYDKKETLSLVEGKPVEALGSKLTYTGYRQIEGEKFAFNVRVERNGRTYNVAPIMYYSSFNEGLMRNPDIVNLVTEDFYVAPLSLEQKKDPGNADKIKLRKNESQKLGTFEVTFLGFDVPMVANAAMKEGGEGRIGATLLLRREGKITSRITPAKLFGKDGEIDEPIVIENRFRFSIASMQPDMENPANSTVEIAYSDLQQVAIDAPADILVVEASTKPYINLVWSGVIILMVGFTVTIVRRAQEARLGWTSSEEE